MAPAAFRTAYLSFALIALPQVLAGPACAQNHYGEPGCSELCSKGWGGGGFSMGNNPWGSVISNSPGYDLNSILSSACGSNMPATLDPAVTPTDSYYHPSPSAADGHIPSPSVPGSGVPPHLTSTRSIPSDSGISPTPNPTSSPPQSPATSPTPTSPTMSHSHPGNSLSHSPPNSLSHSPPHSPSPSPPPPPSTTGGSVSGSVSGSFEQEVLAAHNSFRKLHGAAALTWDQELATYAENWGSQCNFKHSGGPYGENLAAGTKEGYTASDGIQQWTDEAKYYNPSNPTFTSEAGHFTQVVWKNTTSVGCALVDCAPGKIFSEESHFLVCEYYSPGNVLTQFEKNVQA